MPQVRFRVPVQVLQLRSGEEVQARHLQGLPGGDHERLRGWWEVLRNTLCTDQRRQTNKLSLKHVKHLLSWKPPASGSSETLDLTLLFFCLVSSGQLYGLEKFWAFLKYSKAKTLEIDPKLQECLSKFKRLEDFRIDVSRILFGEVKRKWGHSVDRLLLETDDFSATLTSMIVTINPFLMFYWNVKLINYFQTMKTLKHLSNYKTVLKTMFTKLKIRTTFIENIIWCIYKRTGWGTRPHLVEKGQDCVFVCKSCALIKTGLHLISTLVIFASSRLWRKDAAEDTHPAGTVAAGTHLSPPVGPTARRAPAPAPPPPPRASQPRMMPNPPAREPPPLTPHQMPRHWNNSTNAPANTDQLNHVCKSLVLSAPQEGGGGRPARHSSMRIMYFSFPPNDKFSIEK